MQLRKDLPLRTRIFKTGGVYGFRIPKVLIDIGYLNKEKHYKVWIEELEE